MARKILLLSAAATGYVLGTKAGRERYEQLKTQATRLWSDPQVQQARTDAQAFVAEQAPVVKDRVADVAAQAAAKVKDVAGTSSSSASDHS